MRRISLAVSITAAVVTYAWMIVVGYAGAVPVIAGAVVFLIFMYLEDGTKNDGQ